MVLMFQLISFLGRILTIKIKKNMVHTNLSLKASQFVSVESRYHRGTNPWDNKITELFKLQGSEGGITFWTYRVWGNYTSQGSMLQEVSSEVYEQSVKKLLADAEKYNNGEYDDGEYRHTLVQKAEQEIVICTSVSERYGRIQFEGTRIETVSPTSPVASFVAEALAEYRAAEAEKRAAEAVEQKQYAQECGRTARRLGINFINVLRLGYEDENKLMAFQKSIQRAQQIVEASDADLKDHLYHEIVECGRDRRKAALASLGIIVDADVNYMQFDELFA